MKRVLATLLAWLGRTHRPTQSSHPPLPPSLIARRVAAIGRSGTTSQYRQALRLAELEGAVHRAAARLEGFEGTTVGPARQRRRALNAITEFIHPALGSYRTFLDSWPPQTPADGRLLDLAEEILSMLATRADDAAELCEAFSAAEARLRDLEGEYCGDLPETWASLVTSRKVKPRLASAQSIVRPRGVMKELEMIGVALRERQEFYRHTMTLGGPHAPLEARGHSLERLWWDTHNATLARAAQRWQIAIPERSSGDDHTYGLQDFGDSH